MLKRMLIAALGMGLIAAGVVSEASAKTRSCQAEYRFQAAPPTVNKTERPVDMPLARFSAAANCTAANKCRERARAAILSCGKAHRRTPTRIPAGCTGRTGVSGYATPSLPDLFGRGVIRACCTAPLGPHGTRFKTAQLVLKSSGGKRCGGEIVVWGPHATFNCGDFADRCAAGNW